MSEVTTLRLSRGIWMRLFAIAFAAVVAGAVFLAGIDLREWIDWFFRHVREAGPVVFFGAMALLPAFGCPISLFTLTAAPVFGLWPSLAGVAASVALNVTLCYWLARRWLRPWIEALLSRRGYRVPRLEGKDAGEFAWLVRITPGPPFFLQSYLLGVADVPFRTYFGISWLMGSLYAAGFVVFGDSLFGGKAGMAIVAASLMVALLLATRILRRRYGVRNSQP